MTEMHTSHITHVVKGYGQASGGLLSLSYTRAAYFEQNCTYIANTTCPPSILNNDMNLWGVTVSQNIWLILISPCKFHNISKHPQKTWECSIHRTQWKCEVLILQFQYCKGQYFKQYFVHHHSYTTSLVYSTFTVSFISIHPLNFSTCCSFTI